MDETLKKLIGEARTLVLRALALTPVPASVDWNVCRAAMWRHSGLASGFAAHSELDQINLDDLLEIDDQKAAIDRNTRQFLAGLPSNNVLLWGARGTGKSSLIHALINAHADDGLRLVEVSKEVLAGLPEIVHRLKDQPYRFILFCDDLSFEADDPTYKALKSALEGSMFRSSGNVLIYATSNRRHLLPEYMSDNTGAAMVDGELHQSEAVEEKISLSDRFGLWLSFYPFKQQAYLSVVHHWVRKLAADQEMDLNWDEAADKAALRWALARGVRSGRTAQHFARDYVGRQLLHSLDGV
jgi:predicted AAA+ superfamily ATPase